MEIGCFNGLVVDGDIIDVWRYSLIIKSLIFIYFGEGWWGSYNFFINYISIYNFGIIVWLNEVMGDLRLDIVVGFMIGLGVKF